MPNIHPNTQSLNDNRNNLGNKTCDNQHNIIRNLRKHNKVDYKIQLMPLLLSQLNDLEDKHEFH